MLTWRAGEWLCDLSLESSLKKSIVSLALWSRVRVSSSTSLTRYKRVVSMRTVTCIAFTSTRSQSARTPPTALFSGGNTSEVCDKSSREVRVVSVNPFLRLFPWDWGFSGAVARDLEQCNHRFPPIPNAFNADSTTVRWSGVSLIDLSLSSTVVYWTRNWPSSSEPSTKLRSSIFGWTIRSLTHLLVNRLTRVFQVEQLQLEWLIDFDDIRDRMLAMVSP